MGEPITVPGRYDISADDYHADPVPGGSLSSTGARKLLPPSCPALFKHWREHPEPHKRDFDLGHAAHRNILHAGADIVLVDFPDYRKQDARAARDAAYDKGQIPVLPQEDEQVAAMARALRADRLGRHLFQPGRGKPEQTLVWIDDKTGVWCRAMLDWLPNPSVGRLVVFDYKTTKNAAPSACRKAIADYGYHVQAAHYLDGVRAVGLDSDPAFVFVFQDKTPPHLVTLIQLDETALRVGAEDIARAREIYRDCTESDVWPSYSTDVEMVGLPLWMVRQHEEQM